MRVVRALVAWVFLSVPATGIAAQAPAKSATELTADSLLKAGNPAAALPLYQQLAARDSIWPRFWYGIGMSHAAMRHDAEAARAFERASANGKMAGAMYNAGAMHARMGHTDQALDWLEKSVTAGFLAPAQFTGDTDLVALRSNPRFQAIVKKASTPPTPCLTDPNFRKFDFWVGEWDVTLPNATVVVGHSVIQVISTGCALLENWTATNGSDGKSINTYNRAVGQWQQYWIGSGGEFTDYRESHWDGPTLVYLTRPTSPQGAPLQRLSFTPIDPNTVRQFGEASSDGGTTWKLTFDLHYHRKK